MFTHDGLQMLTQLLVTGAVQAAPWLLGAAALIVGLTRGEARRALLSFIRAARRRTEPPPLTAAELATLLDHIRHLEERVSYAERALIKQMTAGTLGAGPHAERIVVPPQLMRTPV